MVIGNTPDNPVIVNPHTPVQELCINGILVDMVKFTKIADGLGWEVGDRVSFRGYVNSEGKKVADYESIRIEKKADE